MSPFSSTLAMEALPKFHHPHLPFNRRHFSPAPPFSSLSFRPQPPPPFSSSSSKSLRIRATSSPSPKQNPQNPFLRALVSPFLEPTYIAIVASVFFLLRLQLKPAAATAPFIPPPPATESATVAEESLPAEQDEISIEERLSSNPDDTDALRSLVEVKVRARKIDEAVQAVDRLIELEPEEFDLLLLKAHLYSHSGQHELARDVFEEMLKKDPFQAEAYHGLLMATSELKLPTGDLLKRIEEAMKRCEEVEEKAFEAREFKLLIAQIKVIEDDYSGALKVYQELVKEEPRDFRPYLCQGVVYTLLKKKDEADKQFEKYRKLVPENHPYKEYFEDNTNVFLQKLQGIGAKSSE